jgi:flavin reductase (DIM6/NTAB) family NADH-FMN oxidoreductase RutF
MESRLVVDPTLVQSGADGVATEPSRAFLRPEPRIERDEFRSVLRNVPVPVAVLTTAKNGRWYGITISSFMTVALDPPMVAVSLTIGKPASSATVEAGCFAINFLDQGASAIADRFADHHSLAGFEGIAVETGPRELPILSDALGVLLAETVSVEKAGDHYLITGEVFAGHRHEGMPLIRHQSLYTRPRTPIETE